MSDKQANAEVCCELLQMDLHQQAKRPTAGTKIAPCGVGMEPSRVEGCDGGLQLVKVFISELTITKRPIFSMFAVAPMLISQIHQYNKLNRRGVSGGRV